MVRRAATGSPWAPPRAEDWNAIGEATEAWQRDRRTRDAAQLKQWILPTDWVWCKNNTGDRRAGDVLECGDYLLSEIDPMSLWFAGQAPTEPVRESTHGVLRVACKSGKLERVQVSGVVRAWVNVLDEDHHFCDAVVGEYVLESNNRGPHKITYKPSGTGELECVVLLYADTWEPVLAEAYAMTDHTPADGTGGTGTGSEGQQVFVYDFRLLPRCELINPPPKCTNPKNHRWPAGSLLTLVRKECPDSIVEWQVCDVELRKICMVNGIKKDFNGTSTTEGCVKSGSVVVAGEWAPSDEPDEACELFKFGPCTGTVTCADLTWTVLVGPDCCVEE